MGQLQQKLLQHLQSEGETGDFTMEKSRLTRSPGVGVVEGSK